MSIPNWWGNEILKNESEHRSDNFLIIFDVGEPPREFHDAIEALAHVFSNRVSEYIMGDLESVSVSSNPSSKSKSSENLASGVVPHGARSGNGMHQGNSIVLSWCSNNISDINNFILLFRNKTYCVYNIRSRSWPQISWRNTAPTSSFYCRSHWCAHWGTWVISTWR